MNRLLLFLRVLFPALLLAGCAVTPPMAVHPEARPFIAASPPAAAIDAALARAKAAGKLVILVFGSDACHDSRGLAGWFATDRFTAMMQPRFEIAWIDVGIDKAGNADLAARFGLGPIVGTPTVLVVDGDGKPLSLSDAPTWRNAASRSEDEIFNYFSKIGEQHP